MTRIGEMFAFAGGALLGVGLVEDIDRALITGATFGAVGLLLMLAAGFVRSA